MKRFCRWTLNALAALSLVLCVATVRLWARSGPAARRLVEYMRIDADHWRVELWCGSVYDGRLKIFREVQSYWDRAGFDTYVRPPSPFYEAGWASKGTEFTFNSEVHPSFWLRAGFSFDRQATTFLGMDQHVSGITLPLWFCACVTTLLPLTRGTRFVGAWRRRVKASRGARGLCPSCSYDLMGNVSGVCPECGSGIVKGNA